MGARQEKLREILKEVLEDYCSVEDLNTISEFLIKAVDSVENDKPSITNMDKFMFTQSVKNVSVGVSRELIIETMKSSMSKIKNLVKPAKINKGMQTYTKNNDYESNSAEFDIDIEAIPKVDGRVVRGSMQNKVFTESNVFEGSFDEDLEKINSSKAKVEAPKSESGLGFYETLEKHKSDTDEDLPFFFGSDESSTDSGEDMSTDASKFNGEYSDVPKVSISTDY